jgi:hypothetical protein
MDKFTKLYGKAVYVPAIGEQFASVWNRKLSYKGKDLKFFTNDSHFKMPAGLQSAYYGLYGVGKKIKTTYKEEFNIPDDFIFIADSGGYQIASWARKGEVCQLEPIDSLRWQEENCDVAMNLDVPPNIDGNPSHNDFMKALEQSIKNFELFQKERKNYDMRLLNVLHGETLPMMDIWYNAVKHFKFDGWAVGMKPPFDPMIQVLGFMYLWEKGEFDKDSCKNFHFFGTSGKHVVPAIVYIAHKMGGRNITVSYDSSSYNIGSIYRTYYLPFDIGPHISFGDKFLTENPHLKELPCKCPVCLSIGDDIDILNGKDIYAGALISLHNLYQYWRYNDLLNALVVDKALFIDYLQKVNISPKTLKAIEFVDYAMEKGLVNAVDKFKNDLMLQVEFDKTKQATIWGF